MPKRKKLWSFSAGERGLNKVRAFAHNQTGLLFLEFTEIDAVSGVGIRRRVALGHRDTDAAKAAAETLAARLRTATPATEPELTVGALFDSYEREVTPTKAKTTQGHDRRTLEMVLRHVGKGRRVLTLDRRDWDSFIRERRAGRLVPVTTRPKGARKIKQRAIRPVRDRIVEQDLRLVLAVLNWATRLRSPSGEPVLARNPFAGLDVPREQSPNRPMLSPKDLATMSAVADQVSPQFGLLLVTAYLTGHRIGAVSQLRWSDLDLEARRVRWRAENDKIAYDHVTPLAPELVDRLKAAQRARRTIGEAWVFTAPADQSKPLPRLLARDWWQRAETLAGLKPVKGRGWHSLRRLFASELRHTTPMKDLCHLGGWKNPQTVLMCYQQSDEDTMRKALEQRPALPCAEIG
ncbi:MAG: site-specific integrase [Gemmatimonadaceae bacterium]|jgi:integrase